MPRTGFTGYIIAVCNFQLAHGYALFSDTGIRNWATGYLALVIPTGTGNRNSNILVRNAARGTNERVRSVFSKGELRLPLFFGTLIFPRVHPSPVVFSFNQGGFLE